MKREVKAASPRTRANLLTSRGAPYVLAYVSRFPSRSAGSAGGARMGPQDSSSQPSPAASPPAGGSFLSVRLPDAYSVVLAFVGDLMVVEPSPYEKGVAQAPMGDSPCGGPRRSSSVAKGAAGLFMVRDSTRLHGGSNATRETPPPTHILTQPPNTTRPGADRLPPHLPVRDDTRRRFSTSPTTPPPGCAPRCAGHCAG